MPDTGWGSQRGPSDSEKVAILLSKVEGISAGDLGFGGGEHKPRSVQKTQVRVCLSCLSALPACRGGFQLGPSVFPLDLDPQRRVLEKPQHSRALATMQGEESGRETQGGQVKYLLEGFPVWLCLGWR